MRKLILSLITISMALSSCGKSAKIQGSFDSKEFDNEYMYLQVSKDLFGTSEDNLQVLDSAQVKDGKFTFQTKLTSKADIAIISLGKLSPSYQPNQDYETVGSIVLEEGTINIKFDETSTEISGTPKNDDYNKLQKKAGELSEEYMMLMQLAQSGQMTEDQQMEMSAMFQGKVAEYEEMDFDFMLKNMDNRVGESLFAASYKNLDHEQLEKLLPSISEEIKSNEKVAEHIKRAKDLSEGKDPYMDVNLEDLAGTKVKLSDYIDGKGNYVLLDFWAHWCGPCIAEFPFLKDAYTKYKEKGFEIVAVSVDQDREKWEASVKEHKLPWVHLIDAEGEASTSYQIRSIPFTLLVDKEGNIVEANLRGAALSNKLEELLK